MAKKQKFDYDRENIWIVNDGEDQFYAFDSEKAAKKYAKKHGYTPESIPRSPIEVHGYKMYQLLKRIAKRIANPTEFDKAAIASKIAEVCAEVEKDENLTKIMDVLGLQL